MGVKQGEPLSPLPFILFINDMSNAVFDEKADIVSFDDLQIFLLLFADDTAIFSYTEFGLQALLKRLEVNCKSGVLLSLLILRKLLLWFLSRGQDHRMWNYIMKAWLNQVTKCTYLGVTLSANGKFYQMQNKLWLS